MIYSAYTVIYQYYLNSPIYIRNRLYRIYILAAKIQSQNAEKKGVAINWVSSVVVCLNLKVCLRVIADGAGLGCFPADTDVSAVCAFPDLCLGA